MDIFWNIKSNKNLNVSYCPLVMGKKTEFKGKTKTPIWSKRSVKLSISVITDPLGHTASRWFGY